MLACPMLDEKVMLACPFLRQAKTVSIFLLLLYEEFHSLPSCVIPDQQVCAR